MREVATLRTRPAPYKLAFDHLTVKVVSESRVTWATSVPILVFLCLSIHDLGPMYVTDVRQTDVRHQTRTSLNMPPLWGWGIISSDGHALSRLPPRNDEVIRQVKLVHSFVLRVRKTTQKAVDGFNYYPPPIGKGALSVDVRLTSVCLSVCLSVAYLDALVDRLLD